MTIERNNGTRYFRIIWKDGGDTNVEVTEGARRLYRENDFDIAAALACIATGMLRNQIHDVREV